MITFKQQLYLDPGYTVFYNIFRDSRGCTGFDWCGSGYRLQVERPSPDWAKI